MSNSQATETLASRMMLSETFIGTCMHTVYPEGECGQHGGGDVFCRGDAELFWARGQNCGRPLGLVCIDDLSDHGVALFINTWTEA